MLEIDQLHWFRWVSFHLFYEKGICVAYVMANQVERGHHKPAVLSRIDGFSAEAEDCFQNSEAPVCLFVGPKTAQLSLWFPVKKATNKGGVPTPTNLKARHGFCSGSLHQGWNHISSPFQARSTYPVGFIWEGRGGLSESTSKSKGLSKCHIPSMGTVKLDQGTCMYVSISVSLSLSLSFYMYIICIYIYTHILICLCIYMYIYIYMHIYAHTYHTHIYIYIYI